MKPYIPESKLPRVVIIGAGFGGIQLAKSLIKTKQFQVVLLDKHNYHTFQPLLYQVATGGLEPDSIAYSIRQIFHKKKNFIFRMADVERIDTNENEVITNIGEITYEHLVVATGTQTNFFGFDGISSQMMSLKTVPEALNMRSFILQNFENALLTDNHDKKSALMNIVIVGGGPTGVELAGALGEMKKYVLPNDYPELDLEQMQIYLFERQPRVLSNMSEVASKKTEKYLKELGVQIFTSTSVNDFDGKNKVVYGDNNEVIKADTFVWTAGVKGNLVGGLDEKVILRGNRIQTDSHNQILGYDNIYAIGDIAAMIEKDTPRGHPQVAPVAIQQAELLAKNLMAKGKKQPLKAFKYTDKGSMATVGRNRAVVDLPNFKFQGVFAWFVWLAVHLISLVGFRNKIAVIMDWIYNYFTYDRAMRLIIRPYHRKSKDD
ncbi:MAG: NAD(P)/FAD-dependent oxidoreductase [Saprospiraceae bacterium]